MPTNLSRGPGSYSEALAEPARPFEPAPTPTLSSALRCVLCWRITASVFLMVFLVAFAILAATAQMADPLLAFPTAGTAHALLLGAFVVVTVTAGTMAVLHALLLKPFVKLTRSMRSAAIAPWHATAFSIRTGRTDEIGDMVRALNAMLQRVEDSVHAERQLAEERAGWLSHHDPVSGLPNRSALLQRLASTGPRASTALLLANIVELRNVNAAHGQQAGDRLIREVGSQLAEAAGGDSFTAHLGGGRFAIACATGPDAAEAAALAERLVSHASRSHPRAAGEVQARLNVGIARGFDGITSPEEMLDRSELALARAGADEADYAFFAQGLAAEFRERQAMARDLDQAIRDPGDAFRLVFQPQFIVRDAQLELSGAEALSRWRRPTGDEVPPSRFIPIAESTGLMSALGERTLAEACKQAAAWRALGAPPLRLAVNLSARQFADAALVGCVERELLASGAPADSLEIEITESVAMQDVESTIATLRGLRQLGVTLALDDFGTGHSSLGVLRQLEVDVIKIDRSFVDGIGRDARADTLCAAIVQMARALGKRVIAEGVETREQLAFLQSQGCQEIQGYLLGRPVAPCEFAALHFPTRAFASV